MEPARDIWLGLSTDLIERCIDVGCVRAAWPPAMQRLYRSELVALDRWMWRGSGRTLVAARTVELRAYLRCRYATRTDGLARAELVACLRQFYAWLRECGCCAGDPTAQLGNPVRIAPICAAPAPAAPQTVAAVAITDGG